MIFLFTILTALNLLSLASVAALGYAGLGSAALSQWHQISGIFAAIVCCAVHCVVFTYFMATAKWIQHAVSVKNLDAALTAPTRSFKAQAYPAALGAIVFTLVAAFAGAAISSYAMAPTLHHLLAVLAFLVNSGAAAFEYRAIGRNGRLIDEILDLLNSISSQG